MHIPDGPIRNIQARLLRAIFDKFDSPEYVYAFESEKNIPEMAKLHTGKDYVVSLDLTNFFGNVTQQRINQILLDRIPTIHHSVARTISELVTYKAYLPQGGVTSPKVSNIVVAHTFGPELFGFTNEHNLKLSIYADDVTISFNGTRGQANAVAKAVEDIVNKYGFKINRKKTKIMHKTQRQWVCGAVVNEKTNLVKKGRYELKARVHNIAKNGIESETARAGFDTSEEYINSLKGRINWYRQLNQEKGQALMAKLELALLAQVEVEETVEEAVLELV